MEPLETGATIDGIIFRLFGSGITTISGDGDFDALRILFAGSSNLALSIQMDVTLRGTGPVLYNVGTGTVDFDVTITSGNTFTATAGNVSIDGAAGNGSNDTGGTWTVNGTLDVAGTFYMESNNTATTGNLAQLSIGATGTVIAGQASTSSSGTNRFDLTMASGANLEFDIGSFGALAGATTFTINANAIVTISAGTSTFTYPDGNTGADTDVENILKISGSGTKTFSGDLTINGKMSLSSTLAICQNGIGETELFGQVGLKLLRVYPKTRDTV